MDNTGRPVFATRNQVVDSRGGTTSTRSRVSDLSDGHDGGITLVVLLFDHTENKRSNKTEHGVETTWRTGGAGCLCFELYQ